jgi:hypothetical protein
VFESALWEALGRQESPSAATRGPPRERLDAPRESVVGLQMVMMAVAVVERELCTGDLDASPIDLA